ncbi:unnamed protein product, partial [Prorocentrum cordatum]
EQMVASHPDLVGNDKTQSQAVEAALQQHFASRPPPPISAAKPPSLDAAERFKAPPFKQEHICKKVERCCWELVTAEHKVQDIQSRLDELTEEHLQATMAHEAAVVAVAGKGASSEPALPERLAFRLGLSLFVDVDEADEDNRAAAEALQAARRVMEKAYDALAAQKEGARIQSAEAAQLARMQRHLQDKAKVQQDATKRRSSEGAVAGGDAEAALEAALEPATPCVAEAPVPPTPVASEADADVVPAASVLAAEVPVLEATPEREAQHLSQAQAIHDRATKELAGQLA